MTRLIRRAAEPILVSAVIIYVVVFSVLSVARYDTFHATTFDLGIMAQVVWNTAHGRWFETSLGRSNNTELVGSYLGNHVRPILLLLAPLYRLWPDPRLLLVLQSVALGIAAIPLYWIARRQTGDVMAALIVACGYLAYPALGFINLFDFHPIVFSVPFVFLAYWAMLEERSRLFWGAVCLSLFTKEELVIPIAMWGLVNLLQKERRRVGSGLLILAVTWASLCFGLVIPYFNDGQPYRFWQLWLHLPCFSALSSIQGGVQSAAGASPQTIGLFLVHLLLPLGFLPFLGSTAFVVSLPSLAYLLIGKRAALHTAGSHYPAVLVPWFFLAAVEGLRRLRRKAGRSGGWRLYRSGLAFLLIGTIGTNAFLNSIVLYSRAGVFQPTSYHAQIEEALAQIPPGASVATINSLGPPLAHRRVLVALEYPPPFRLDHVQAVDYVLLDLVNCRAVLATDPRHEYADMLLQVLNTGLFRVRYWSDRILLLERGPATADELAALAEYVTNLVELDQPCWP
jgi:uncharacterized membrane protein